MTPTQEWIDRHTPSPETLAKIRDQRAAKMPQRKGKDADEDMAKRYLGLCPGCSGMVNFGHMFIRRNGIAYHRDCDPNKPPPACWCGQELPDLGDTEHQGCFDRRVAVSRFCGALTGIFSEHFVNWPKMRGFKL